MQAFINTHAEAGAATDAADEDDDEEEAVAAAAADDDDDALVGDIAAAAAKKQLVPSCILANLSSKHTFAALTCCAKAASVMARSAST